MQPSNPTPSQPMQQALTQQQQPQQGTTPGIIDIAQQQLQQGAQTLNAEDQQARQTNEQNTPQQQAAISRALAALNPGANSGNKAFDTASKVGQAINPSSQWANLCEAFTEKQIYGHTGMYPTAYAAYQANANSGNINTSTNKIPANAQVFMAPDSSNGMNGHTGVMQSNGKFLAPLSNGNIEQFTIPEWEKYSGQKFIGWAPPPKK